MYVSAPRTFRHMDVTAQGYFGTGTFRHGGHFGTWTFRHHGRFGTWKFRHDGYFGMWTFRRRGRFGTWTFRHGGHFGTGTFRHLTFRHGFFQHISGQKLFDVNISACGHFGTADVSARWTFRHGDFSTLDFSAQVFSAHFRSGIF